MNKELDLNLLKILVLLEKHRQLKPVAKALGKSEASISKYLARLRYQLNDELFIRHPHHLEPTEFVLRKLPEITDALERLDRCIVRSKFKPENYDKDITISLPQMAQYSFGHLLAKELIDIFPKASVTITTNNEHTIEDILLGKIDIQLHYFNDELPKSIYQRFVGYAPTIVVVSEESGITTLERAAELPFVMFSLIGWKEREQLAKRAMENKGFTINRVVTFDNVNALLKFVKENGAAGILHDFQAPIEGFRFIPIPESYFVTGWPKVVAQMKQVHRHDAMHQILTDAIANYMTKKN